VFYVLKGELDLLAFHPAAGASGTASGDCAHAWESETGAQAASSRPRRLTADSGQITRTPFFNPGSRAQPGCSSWCPRRATRYAYRNCRKLAGRRRTTGSGRDRGAPPPPRHSPAHPADKITAGDSRAPGGMPPSLYFLLADRPVFRLSLVLGDA
jgi:hypothetical protein